MALRNQPYIPLFVQDYLTDEKLNMCSWATQGIYIKIICVLHKQEEYGCILFKQADKLDFCQMFARILLKHIPCEKEEMILALQELVENKVLKIEGNKLFQPRMIKDNSLSKARTEAGSKGGIAKAKGVAKGVAKHIANSEYEYETEYEVRTSSNIKNKQKVFTKPSLEEITQYLKDKNSKIDPQLFYAYYESRGWRTKSGPVKNWQQCVVTWERNNIVSQVVASPPHAKENETLPTFTQMLEGKGGDACPDDIREMLNKKLGRVK